MLKRMISSALCGALVLGCMTAPALAAEGVTPPAVQAVVVGIEEGILEVGLQVNGTMSSVAGVLQYDATLLSPCDWSEEAAEVTMTAATSWATSVLLPAKAPDNIIGKASVGYEAENVGHMTLIAEALQPIALTQTSATAATADAAAEQVVTVRMKYTGEFAAASATIKFETNADVAKASPAGAVVLAGNKADSVEVTAPTVAVITQGVTVNTGAVGNAEFVSIVFYDWDDTQLGSIAVQKGADATAAVAAFTAANATSMVHEGYAFENVWVPSINDMADSIYGHYRDSSNAAVQKDAPASAVAFTTVNESMSVRAAYNGSSVTNSTALAEQHTVSYVSSERLDKTGNYALTFQVERGSNPATVDGYLVAEQTTGSTTVKTGTAYDGKDTDQVIVVVGPTVTVAKVYTADGYGKSVYALAAAKSNALTKSAAPGDASGYVLDATLAYINSCLAIKASNSSYSGTMFSVDLGLGSITGNLGNWRGALQGAYDTKGSALTLDDIKTALADFIPAA